MGVPLRCGDGGMSKEFLYHANIDPVLEKQRSHGVSQHMGGYMSFDSRLSAKLSNYVCDSLRGKSLSRRVEEECRVLSVDLYPGPEVVLLNLQAFFIDCKSQARTSSFTLYFEHSLCLEKICDIERRCFPNSYACGEQDVNECQVPGSAVLSKGQRFLMCCRRMCCPWALAFCRPTLGCPH